MPARPPRVFLAHRTPDKPIAVPLAAALRARGVDVWLDQWEIRSGDNFVEKMEQGLLEADGGLLLCSDTPLAGTWTYQEYSVLLKRVVEARGEPKPFLIPVLTHAAVPRPAFPWRAAWHAPHRHRHARARHLWARARRQTSAGSATDCVTR